jgi:hypothetical protein
MARKARAVLADMRAMEEEGERMNPINPKKAIGGAAVPSMGLSQFRGGRAKREHSPEECDIEGAGKMLGEQLHAMHGGAYMAKFMKGMGMCGGMNTGRYEGEGKLEIVHHSGKGMSGAGATSAGMVGGAMMVEGPGYEAVGGKKKRAPAGASDARRARGAAISKLMREKAMSLGEASKHIKEHGY